MLRFLTDEQISPHVAKAVRRQFPEASIVAMRDWQHGHLLSASDDLVLREAHDHGLVLVSYDLRTIPPLLRAWAERGIDHSGVVLIDEQTISQADVGGIAHALCALWRDRSESDWTNRVVFLRRASR